LNFLCDEGVERHIVEALREAGHQVAYIAEIDPSISDAEVLRRAADSEAVLITSDKDFGELVYRQGRAHAGIVLVRLHGLDPVRKAAVVAAAIEQYGESLPGAFCVVEEDRLRIRRGPV
jgi:predicted nuclease of predicted toxin-antitoxin system